MKRSLDLFTGIGGFALAFERAGFESAAFSEIEPFPCKVLQHHWPDTKNYGGITTWPEWDFDEIGPVDVATFGSPCQDLSVAGKRAGLSGERSGLFHDAVAAVRRSGARFALWENVPGAMHANGGRDFGAVLDALADAGALDVAWRVLDAQYFGVPQRRRRVFLVADFAGERAAEVLFEPEGVRGHPEKGGEEGQEAAGGSESGARGCSRLADTLTVGANQYSGFIGEPVEVSKTLCGSHRLNYETETFVPTGFDWQSGGDVRHNFTENGSPVLQASQVPAVAYSISGNAIGREPHNGPQRGDVLTDEAHTLTTADRHADYGGMAVRKLTPLECERLQGFPDYWTDIPGASDSARYRALGNSVAVPVVEWIAYRMARVLEAS